MIQTESNIPEKERNSYWDGSPASLKKWTSRGLVALLILYYGGCRILPFTRLAYSACTRSNVLGLIIASWLPST